MTKPQRRIAWSLFTLIFLLEFTAGYYVAHVKGYFYADAVSRVANAFYVLWTTPPHLAAIGGVWNPLPSLFELPFLLIWRLYKPIATSGLAGVIFSSFFAALSDVILFRAALKSGRSVLTGLLLALLYSCHPFFFVYGFNGMTEVPFSFTLLWLMISFTQWLEDRGPYDLVMMALALMLAFLIRYEAIPVSAVAFGAVLIITLTVHRRRYFDEHGLGWKPALQRLEGESIILLTPVLYSFLVWVLFSWIVLGNPLYFLNSGYSITAFTSEYAANAMLKSLMGHPWRVCQFVFFKTRLFMIPLLLILGFRIWRRRLWQWDFLMLIGFVISTNALQLVDLWKGMSAGWLRYFVYPFPFLVAWLPYEMKKVNTRVFTVLCLVTLLCADLAMGWAWFDPSPRRVGWEEFNRFDFPPDRRDVAARQVASYLNARLPRAKILMDSVKTYLVIMNSNQPWRFVVTSSYQFDTAVRNPRRYHIDYVLIPSTTDTDPFYMDAINKRYPDLYKNGAPWCVLTKKFGSYFSLYRIIPHNKKHPTPGAGGSEYLVNRNSGMSPAAHPNHPTDNVNRPDINQNNPIEKAAQKILPPRRDSSPQAAPVTQPAFKPKPAPPDLADIYWEGAITTANDQIIMIQYHEHHYLLHLGEAIPGTEYVISKLNPDSVTLTLSAYGKLQYVRKKGM